MSGNVWVQGMQVGNVYKARDKYRRMNRYGEGTRDGYGIMNRYRGLDEGLDKGLDERLDMGNEWVYRLNRHRNR